MSRRTAAKARISGALLAALVLQGMLPCPSISAANAADSGIAPRRFDILVRGGEIIDGSGSPRYRADIGIVGDEIVAIGRLEEAAASRIVDAKGRIVTPGFIDMHSHVAEGESGETGLLSADRRRRAAQNFVAQGITTCVANPDGGQTMPLSRQRRLLTKKGIGPNVILLSGHSGMRREVMRGDVDRPATAEEIRRMQQRLQSDLAREGSFGMSLGLEYDDARHASLEEELALGRVLSLYGGIFIPHLRSQGISPMWYRPSADKKAPPPTLDQSIDETLQVAQSTGATVVFTHMKAWGPGYRGQASRLIERLQQSRDRGARVYMDVYPYDSSASDGDFVALPPWAFEPESQQQRAPFDYSAALEAVLAGADPARMQDLALDVRHQIALKGGAANVRVLEFPRAEYVGKSYAELMALRGLDEVGLAIALQREGEPQRPGGSRMRSFSMEEQDIARFYSLDWCAVSTDGWIVLPEEAVGELKYSNTNRRLFGSYPRRLAYFSQERGVDSLEHAVRSASGLPAQILNLRDRGRLEMGMKADVVVLDMGALRDNTTYLEPSVYPSGVEYVLVNGRFVVDAGERTLALPGRVLAPAGRQPPR